MADQRGVGKFGVWLTEAFASVIAKRIEAINYGDDSNTRFLCSLGGTAVLASK